MIEEGKEIEVQKDTRSRKFMIIEMPPGTTNLPTRNIGFYKSTGGGNPDFNNIYKDTWIPFFGIVNEGEVQSDNYHNGLIIKASTLIGHLFLQEPANLWIQILCSQLYIDGIRFENKNEADYFNYFDVYLKKNSSIQTQTTNDVIIAEIFMFNLKILYPFLNSYFNNYIELQISAFLDKKGFWEKYQNFREFCLNHDLNITSIEGNREKDDIHSCMLDKIKYNFIPRKHRFECNIVIENPTQDDGSEINLELSNNVVNSYLTENDAFLEDKTEYIPYCNTLSTYEKTIRWCRTNMKSIFFRFRQFVTLRLRDYNKTKKLALEKVGTPTAVSAVLLEEVQSTKKGGKKSKSKKSKSKKSKSKKSKSKKFKNKNQKTKTKK
jgi:hypothetical protein